MKHLLQKTFALKALLLMSLLVGAVSGAWAEETSTLTFKKACGGSGTADDGVTWTITSDASESLFDSTKGIHYGTNNSAVGNITLSTSEITGTISKIVVNASGASGVTAALNVTVGGNNFGDENQQNQSISSTATNYTFEGSASGEIIVTLKKPSKVTKALYVKSIAVTYTNGPAKTTTTLTLDPSSLSLTAYGTPATLTATVTPDGGSALDNPNITWTSSDESVATVESGVVTPLEKGSAIITASYAGDGTYEKSSNTCSVTVSDTRTVVNLSTFTATNTTLITGGAPNSTITSATNDQAGWTAAYIYSSDNEAVATVDENGVITAVSKGTCTITCSLNVANNDASYKAGETSSMTIEITINNPSHTATFSVNGETTIDSFEEGAAITFPGNPAEVSGKTFVGWTATVIDGTTNAAPEFVKSATMGQSDVTFYAVFAYATGSGSAEVTKSYGFETESDEDWTISDAIVRTEGEGNTGSYAGKISTNDTYVTFNSKVRVKEFSFAFKRTSNNNNYNVYIETSEDNSNWTAAETYAMSSFNNGSYLTKTMEFEGSPELYVRFHCKNTTAVRYVDDVTITYISGGGASYSDYCTTVVADSKQDAGLAFSVSEVNANISEQFEAPTLNTAEDFNGEIEYTSSDESVAQIMDSETGDLRLLKEGTTTITATFAGNNDFRPGSASYTLNVTDNRIATTITQENIVLDIADIATLTKLNPVVKDAENNVIEYEFSEFLSIVSFEKVSEDDVISSIDGNTGAIILSGNVGTATLKAYYNRFNENTTYKPSECTFTITVESTQTIAEARAQGTGSVTTKGVVTSCSGTTAYIQDATAAICVYGSALTVGDEVKVNGTLKDYNGLLEITNPTVTVRSQGNTITPEVMTIANINASENQGWLVKIEDATVTAIDGQNTTIAQGDNTIVVRGITGIEIAVNDVITLTGNIGCYNAAQIANPTNVAVKVTPIITLNPASINATAAETEGSVALTYTNLTITASDDFDVQYYDSEGEETDTPDWLLTEVAEDNGNYVVSYVIEANDGEARTAYFKVFAMNDEEFIYSNLVTISQEAYVAPTPSIVFDGSQNPMNVSYIAGNTNVHYVASYTEGDIEVVICDAEGNPTTYDWFSASYNSNVYVAVSWEANEDTENSRTAYFKLVAGDTESEVFAVTQAKYVVDYATLPFEFNDGKADITTGLTQSGLGSDYNSNTAPNTQLKFDGTADYLILKLNERPGILTFDIKGNSFSGGTFKVQTSEDGVTYTDLETYTELGDTQNEVFENFGENVRYIKWVYTEKSSGNVGLGNISVYAKIYTRDGLTVDNFGTICLPYDANIRGAQLYSIAGKKENKHGTYIVLNEEETMEAGKPYIFQATASSINCYRTSDAEAESAETVNGLVGSFDGMDVDEGNYVLSKNQIVYCGTGCSIAANRAYIDMSEVPEYVGTGEANVKMLYLNDITTGINGIDANGEGAVIYDLSGRRLSKAQKGLYIVNGKKVSVK